LDSLEDLNADSESDDDALMWKPTTKILTHETVMEVMCPSNIFLAKKNTRQA